MSTIYPEKRLDYTDRDGPRYIQEHEVPFHVFAKRVLDFADMSVEDAETGVMTHYHGNRVIGLEVGVGAKRRYIVVTNDTLDIKKDQIIPNLPRFNESE